MGLGLFRCFDGAAIASSKDLAVKFVSFPRWTPVAARIIQIVSIFVLRSDGNDGLGGRWRPSEKIIHFPTDITSSAFVLHIIRLAITSAVDCRKFHRSITCRSAARGTKVTRPRRIRRMRRLIKFEIRRGSSSVHSNCTPMDRASSQLSIDTRFAQPRRSAEPELRRQRCHWKFNSIKIKLKLTAASSWIHLPRYHVPPSSSRHCNE